MTRTIAITVFFALSTLFVGCAAEGADSDSDVGVVRAFFDEQDFELVEMHDADGFIDVDVYYAVGQEERIGHEVFRWPAAEPTPIELLERLHTVDPRVLDAARPLSADGFEAPTISPDHVWPRLLQEARIERRFELPSGCEDVGLADCAQAR
ncbi:MAG: hypothetical protein H6719_06860 [Sandaracinaceae bacterium]|nr:hypothetical protein [Sandaracinaceae bacterium]